MANSLSKRVPEKILVEYQKAQDSAEHYNTMIWTLISVVFAFSLTLLYLIFSKDHVLTLNLFLIFIGAFSLFYFSYLIESAHEKKIFKYHVCKQIEEKYDFIGQNKGVESLELSGKENSGKGMKILRTMKIVVLVLYTLALIIVLTNTKLPDELSVGMIIGTVFVCIGIILAFIMEIYYKRNIPVNQNLKKKKT